MKTCCAATFVSTLYFPLSIEFGKEELGKRGCYTGDVSTLDIDLKARHVTNEELSHAIGSSLNKSDAIHRLSSWKPAIWWDRGKYKRIYDP